MSGIAYEWHGKALAAAAALGQGQDRICIMCAESNPAECHRSFIADWLVAHGIRVMHLLDVGKQREHPARLL
jgi:uncharacterized protein (DUF488 family)